MIDIKLNHAPRVRSFVVSLALGALSLLGPSTAAADGGADIVKLGADTVKAIVDGSTVTFPQAQWIAVVPAGGSKSMLTCPATESKTFGRVRVWSETFEAALVDFNYDIRWNARCSASEAGSYLNNTRMVITGKPYVASGVRLDSSISFGNPYWVAGTSCARLPFSISVTIADLLLLGDTSSSPQDLEGWIDTCGEGSAPSRQ